MSDYKHPMTLRECMEAEDGDYSQGVYHDGAAILHNGVPMTIDEIVAALNNLDSQPGDAKDAARYRAMRSQAWVQLDIEASEWDEEADALVALFASAPAPSAGRES